MNSTIFAIVAPLVLGAGALAKNPALGGLWDRLPKWARPIFFAVVAALGAFAGSMATGLPLESAIKDAALAWLAASKGYDLVDGVSQERKIAEVKKKTDLPSKEIRKAARLAGRAGGHVVGALGSLFKKKNQGDE